MGSEEEENGFPEPVFKTRKSTYSGRVTCAICFESCLKKHSKRSNFEAISNKETFRNFAENWSQYEHTYNKVISLVDWSSDKEFMAHKACKGKFFKESFMTSQKKFQTEPLEQFNATPCVNESSVPSSSNEMQVEEQNVRRSSRKSCSYVSTKEENEKICIICNEQKKSKGRNIPVVDMTYKNRKEERHLAEQTLIEFSKLHLKYKNENYMMASERILLASTIKSLFEADVVYHKDCYSTFRSPCWRERYRKSEISKKEGKANDSNEAEEEFFKLINHHIIGRQEIYTLAQLANYYGTLFQAQAAKIRSVDLKSKLTEKFGDKLTFLQRSKVNESEYVLAKNDRIMSDCLNAMSNSTGIEESITVKNIGKMIGQSIISMNKAKEKFWPPTPQDIINSELTPSSDLLYNLIAWIVSPDASYGKNGIVKLPPSKVPKVTKLCTDIESLVPNATPSLNQVLLSLTEYSKTGSSNVVTDLSRLGHGITYSNAKFIEDKWAEWVDNTSKLVPSNIKPVKITPTLVIDNIDFSNKNFHGEQTHNTNCILVQPDDFYAKEAGVEVEADYEFDRKDHRAYKGTKMDFGTLKFSKAKNCKKLKFEKNDDSSKLDNVKRKSSEWAVARYIASKLYVEEGLRIPSWTGFFKLLEDDSDLTKASVGYLPPFTSPPTEMGVIHAAIDRALAILDELGFEKMFLEVDQAIYTKVLDAMFKMDADGSDIFTKLVPRMGGFHVIMCMLKTIYSRFKDSGFITWLVYSGCGGEGTITSALKGGDVKHAIHLHKLMYEAIIRSKIDYLVEIGKFEVNEGEIQELFKEFLGSDSENQDSEHIMEQLRSKIPEIPSLKEGMGGYLELYLEMVDLLLATIHCQRTSNWDGYLECIKKFLPYCFTHNRHNYARNLSYCYVHMKALRDDHPELYNQILLHGFTVSLTGKPFTKIPCDQVIEMTVNRACKSTGGLSGKTENVGASERWMKINHLLAAMRDKLDSITRKRSFFSNNDGKKRWEIEETDIKTMKQTLEEWVPNLWKRDQDIVNIATGCLAGEEMKSNLESLDQRGSNALDDFLKRIIVGKGQEEEQEVTETYYDKIAKEKIISFTTKKAKKEMTAVQDENVSFGEIFSRYEGKRLNLRQIMEWPITSKPYAIAAEDGKTMSKSKSLFRNYLQSLNPENASSQPSSDINTSVVDMMRVVRLISISDAKPPTFLEWAKSIGKYLQALPGMYMHLVFDNYAPVADRSKLLSKGRPNDGQERKIASLNQVLPKSCDWQDFLRNQSNKFRICNLLADYFSSEDFETDKTVYVTKEESCYIKVPRNERNILPELHSCHREADHRLAAHAIYAANSTSQSVCVVADDTDVFILLLYVSSNTDARLYFRQGTRSSKAGVTYHNVSGLAETLGKDICNILPAFHALTGSDYTNPFFRRSKIQSFKKLFKLQPKCALLKTLMNENANVEDVINFVIHIIYNRPLRERTPGDARYAMLFVKKGKKKKFSSTKSLPPDYKSLIQKVMRANFVAYGWSNCLYGGFNQPDPLLYGWKYEDETLMPVWYEGQALPSSDEIQRYFEENQEEFNNPDVPQNQSTSDYESDSDDDTGIVSEDESDD